MSAAMHDTRAANKGKEECTGLGRTNKKKNALLVGKGRQFQLDELSKGKKKASNGWRGVRPEKKKKTNQELQRLGS